MSFDLPLTLAAFGIGIVVGLTGIGGGALMTPVLVLFFDVLPLTAVSSELLAVAIVAPLTWMTVRRRHGFPHWGAATDQRTNQARPFLVRSMRTR